MVLPLKCKYRRIMYEDRQVIEERLKNGETRKSIAKDMNISQAQMLREVTKGMNDKGEYVAQIAQSNVKRNFVNK